MRVLVTGHRGQLGSDLFDLLTARGDDVTGVDLPDLDITNVDSVSAALAGRPDVVINCAAWTAVDDAETSEARAMQVNGDAVRLIAEASRAVGAWLVQVSTDYVFDGLADRPYEEDAEPDPRSAYGRTKLAGEVAAREVLPDAHYVVRTAWLYGLRGNNFVKTMLRLEREQDTVTVVEDQRGQPTYAADLARQIIALVDARPPAGIFHGTNAGETSWFDLARTVFEHVGADPARVLPTDSASFTRPAPRPTYSVLGHARWAAVGLSPMRDWRDALSAAFADGIAR